MHHVGSQLAVQQCKNFGSRYAVTESLAFKRENVVKFGRGNVASLEFGPCVFVVIDRVDRADEVERQAMIPLIMVEGIKGA